MRVEPAIERRIFVVGVPRSGTTLVQSLLAAHSAMTSFTESHFFDQHYGLLPLLSTALLTRDPAPRVREFLEENGEPGESVSFPRPGPLLFLRSRSVARRLLEVLDEIARRRGKSGWVEKTPRHLRFVPFLERVSESGGRTRFVHVIRDGLEVVASLHRASQSWERPYDLGTCVRRWNRDVRFSLCRVGSPHDHFVLYEELTARPEAACRKLFSALGLEWEAGVIARYAAASKELVTEEEVWKADVGRTIRPSGTSAQALTEAERERVRRSLDGSLYAELVERAGATP